MSGIARALLYMAKQKEAEQKRLNNFKLLQEKLTPMLSDIKLVRCSCNQSALLSYSLYIDHEDGEQLFLRINCSLCDDELFSDKPANYFYLEKLMENSVKEISEDPKKTVPSELIDCIYGIISLLSKLLEQGAYEKEPIKCDFNCAQHQQPINMFCYDCNVNICQQCCSEHNEHNVISIIDRINSLKLNEKIAQFSKEFENGLTQSLNWYNQVTLYLDNILKLFAKNRMGSEDELKKIIKQQKITYVMHEINTRILNFIFEVIVKLYHKYKFSSLSNNVIANILNFTHFNHPIIDDSFLDNEPKSIDALRETIEKIESVYCHITFLQDEEPTTPQIKDKVIQLESPCVIKKKYLKFLKRFLSEIIIKL